MDFSLRTGILAIVLSSLNFACSSGGSDGDAGASNDDPLGNIPGAPNGTQNNTDILIAGFWDISFTEDSGEQIVAYVEVNADGLVTEYDDDQNSSGDGLNCFNTLQSQLTALGNNRYQQSDPIDGGFDEFTATKDGDLLTVSYVDVEDENNNGDRTDLIIESYPAVIGIAAADLTPCEQGTSQGNGNSQGTGEPIIGADGIPGHPTADLIGSWTFISITVNGNNVDVPSFLGMIDGAEEARIHVQTNSAYFYEEVDFRGGQLWAEWGFIYFNDGDLDVNQQFDTAGPIERMTIFDYYLTDNGALILSETVNGDVIVYLLRQLT